ncbi:MAG: TonB-dependent receptor [Verrucomicrobia bacterium]|nr:MAG: TonB-dependent receptor [Verrucomicrobiota bacterium]TAE87891.1 MAG: TonB-dependent receptor [Verrucomicrobiota bacterium]TAF25633.1 MAG: TonB-dependent receptor [Verrucomicrobiota bacterium]TAF41418.1 MAG: TonB-dependent receptor [Verrucomicrobiota bacterium]
MTLFRFSPWVVAGVTGFIFPSVIAQSPQALNPLVVEAASDEKQSLTVPGLAASRADLEKTPGGVEVVDPERYLSGRASTVADVFALSAGVFAQPRFGSDEARLSIRGSGLQRTFHGRGIRVLQDGVPLNLADGGFDFQAIDPLAASHIQVWRGANALAYGSSALGGAIDYLSHTGLSAPGGSARLEAGSFGYLRARLAGGFSEGSQDLYLSLSQQSQEGFRRHAEQNNQRLFANYGWKFADHIETRVYLSSVVTDSELPGNLTKAELELDPRQAAPANITGDQKRDFELFRVASKTTVAVGDKRFDLLAAWTYKDLDHPIFQVLDQKSNDALLGGIFTEDGELFGRGQRLRAGLLLMRGETDAANYQNVGGGRGNLLQADEQTASNLEAFVEEQLELGAGFTGVLGVVASRNDRETQRVFGSTPANSSYDRSYDDLAPKLGLRWEKADVQLYGNVSGSYEPPSFSESGTAVVANSAQEATTVELGSRGRRGAFRWDASIYRSELTDELLTIQLPAPAAIGATGTINADRTIHQGVELAGEVDLLGAAWDDDPARRVVFRSAWTWGDYRFDGDEMYGNNRIAGLPRHLVRGELMWENDGGWYAGPTFEWVPVESWIDHRNTFSADAYALLGFKFGRRVEEGVSWFIEAKNLLDERYAATTGVIENADGKDQRQFLPGDGRGVFAGIECRW